MAKPKTEERDGEPQAEAEATVRAQEQDGSPDQAAEAAKEQAAAVHLTVWLPLLYVTRDGPRPALVERAHADGTVDVVYFDQGQPHGLQRRRVFGPEAARPGRLITMSHAA